MASWGSPRQRHKSLGDLFNVTKALPENVQAAFLIAAKKGPIAQRTWVGCAFNAAGKVVNSKSDISSFAKAAQIFHCDQQLVKSFIAVWDSYKSHPSSTPTKDLIAVLVADEAITEKNDSKELRIVVYESTMKGLADKFDAGKFTDAELELLCPAEFLELVSA